MLRSCTLLTVLLSAPLASAQQTWIVDASGSSGSHFTDIPPAIAAASDGDVIRVRAGQYSTFRIAGKSLRIIGDSRLVTIGGIGQVVIESISGQQRVYLQSMTIAPDQSSTPHMIRACLGEVVIRDVQFVSGNSAVSGTYDDNRLFIDRCGQVHLHDCEFGSLGTNSFTRTEMVSLDQSFCQMARTTIEAPGRGLFLRQIEGKGMSLTNSDVFLVDCTVTGSDIGLYQLGSFGIPPTGGAAISTSASNLTVFRGVIRGGTGGDNSGLGMAIGGDGGPGIELLAASTVRCEGMSPSGGAGGTGTTHGAPGPPFVSGATSSITINATSQPPVAAFVGSQTIPSTVMLQVDATNGSPTLIAISLNHRYVPLGPAAVGSLLVDPSSSLLLGPYVTPLALPIEITLGWPADLPIVAQAIVLTGVTAFASNSVVLCVKS